MTIGLALTIIGWIVTISPVAVKAWYSIKALKAAKDAQARAEAKAELERTARELIATSAAGTMAALDMVKQTPEIKALKGTVSQIQVAIGNESGKPPMMAETKQAVRDAGLSNPATDNTSPSDVTLAADVILQSVRDQAAEAKLCALPTLEVKP